MMDRDIENLRNLNNLEFMSFQVQVMLYSAKPSTVSYKGVMKAGSSIIERVSEVHGHRDEGRDYIDSIQKVLDEVEKFHNSLSEEDRFKAERLKGERMSQWRKRVGA